MENVKDTIAGFSPGKSGHALLDEMWAHPPFARLLRDLKVDYEESREQLPVLSRAYEDMRSCEKCPGLDGCVNVLPRYVAKLTRLADGRLVLRTGPCQKALNEEAIRANFLIHDVPDAWFKEEERPSQRSKDLFLRGFEATGALSRKKWVYVTGDPGSGKSFLAFLLAKTLAGPKVNLKVAFVDVRKRFDALKALSYSDRPAFEREIEALCGVDVLFLDSFGDEYKNDYLRDIVLMPILASRSNEKKATFIISSFSLTEIQQLYSTSMSSRIIAGKMARLIESNLLATCRISGRYEF